MNVSCIDNIVTAKGVKDFKLSQILECGQCFYFDRIDETEYEAYQVVAFDRAVRMEQTGDTFRIIGSSLEDFERIWKRYLDMDNDYSVIKTAVIKADEALSTAVNEKDGIRILNQDFFETLISFIISQNKNIPQIKQCVKNISNKYGDAIIGYNGETFYSFPKVEALYNATEEGLRECKVGFRAPYIKSAANAVYSGAVTKEKLDNLDVNEARKLLMTIKGVGEKVANCVLLFGLGRREAFPVDVWMKRIMEQMYFGGEDRSKAELEAFAVEKFGEYSGYAQQYLFDYARTVLFK